VKAVYEDYVSSVTIYVMRLLSLATGIDYENNETKDQRMLRLLREQSKFENDFENARIAREEVIQRYDELCKFMTDARHSLDQERANELTQRLNRRTEAVTEIYKDLKSYANDESIKKRTVKLECETYKLWMDDLQKLFKAHNIQNPANFLELPNTVNLTS
jgi:hypothetical protein